MIDSSNDVLTRVEAQEKIDEWGHFDVLYRCLMDVQEDFGFPLEDSHVVWIALSLSKCAEEATEQQVVEIVTRFVEGECLQECVQYNRPPVPDDFVDLWLEMKPSKNKRVDEYLKRKERERKKRLEAVTKDGSDEGHDEQ